VLIINLLSTIKTLKTLTLFHLSNLLTHSCLNLAITRTLNCSNFHHLPQFLVSPIFPINLHFIHIKMSTLLNLSFLTILDPGSWFQIFQLQPTNSFKYTQCILPSFNPRWIWQSYQLIPLTLCQALLQKANLIVHITINIEGVGLYIHTHIHTYIHSYIPAMFSSLSSASLKWIFSRHSSLKHTQNLENTFM